MTKCVFAFFVHQYRTHLSNICDWWIKNGLCNTALKNAFTLSPFIHFSSFNLDAAIKDSLHPKSISNRPYNFNILPTGMYVSQSILTLSDLGWQVQLSCLKSDQFSPTKSTAMSRLDIIILTDQHCLRRSV